MDRAESMVASYRSMTT